VNIKLLALSFDTFDVGAGFVAKSVGLLEMGSRLFKSVVEVLAMKVGLPTLGGRTRTMKVRRAVVRTRRGTTTTRVVATRPSVRSRRA
jgi:hypothetical protein